LIRHRRRRVPKSKGDSSPPQAAVQNDVNNRHPDEGRVSYHMGDTSLPAILRDRQFLTQNDA
ncbi:hypothetical protein, partial [Cecembia sp.]|uniref:hypothetical protein n=1 Tax=Cecembia sp. TaxID=1898110 RepID=UPI0025C60D8C